MTLREIRAAYPHLFHPNQDWFEGEAFMDTLLPGDTAVAPPRVVGVPELLLPPKALYLIAEKLPLAATLAMAYVHHPQAEVWRRYLWTRDVDALGQRVYMGVNNGLMEIHRHLHLTERWGIPVWS